MWAMSGTGWGNLRFGIISEIWVCCVSGLRDVSSFASSFCKLSRAKFSGRSVIQCPKEGVTVRSIDGGMVMDIDIDIDGYDTIGSSTRLSQAFEGNVRNDDGVSWSRGQQRRIMTIMGRFLLNSCFHRR